MATGTPVAFRLHLFRARRMMAKVGFAWGLVEKGGTAETRSKPVLGGEWEGPMLSLREAGNGEVSAS